MIDTDVKLTRPTNQTYYDINFDNDGDFEKVQGLETSILMSFWGEKRADSSEVPSPELRRGWWGNSINSEFVNQINYEIGSKLWLLYQARILQDTLNFASNYTRQGFTWYIEDKIAKDVRINSGLSNNTVEIAIEIVRFDDSIETAQFELWENTHLEDLET